MKPYTYVIIHNSTGDVLLYEPCKKGYFFHTTGNTGVICYPSPQPGRTGQKAVPLPGGELSSNQDMEAIIRRQAGVDVRPYHYHAVYSIADAGNTYELIYLNVHAHYGEIQHLSAESLEQAKAAVNRIKQTQGHITYQELMQEFTQCPADHILERLSSRNLFHDRDYFDSFSNTKIHWLYNMFLSLRDRLFPVRIYDRMDQLAAVAKSGKWRGDRYTAFDVLFDKKRLKSPGQLYKIVHIQNPSEVTLVLHCMPGNDGENAVFTCDTE